MAGLEEAEKAEGSSNASAGAESAACGCMLKDAIDMDTWRPTGNEKPWTEEEMANAKPMPLPVVELDGPKAPGAEPVCDRRPGQEGFPIYTHWFLSSEQKKLIDEHLDKSGLNEYGDPKGTDYAGKNPLCNEQTGQRTDRYDYLMNRGIDAPGVDRKRIPRASS